MASSASEASQAWHFALKLRKHMMKQLEKIHTAGVPGIDTGYFDAVETTLEQFRLACVQTIFLDFSFAATENAEEVLWAMHTSVNSEYRRLLSRFKQSTLTVERRKFEKLYTNFLRVAQKFYKGYIQRLSTRFDIPELQQAAYGIEVEKLTTDNAAIISPVTVELNSKVLRSCHATLIRLGDLSRYRVQIKQNKAGYNAALTFYKLAHHLLPQSGFALHQMGIVSLDRHDHLDVAYYFYRALAVEFPHPNAKQNLEIEFKAVQSPDLSKNNSWGAGPHDAFAMWFVRLHALFYRGEASSQQQELENEVMHRLEMCTNDHSSNDTLLKMVILNISAHYIASEKYTANPESSTAIFFLQCSLTLMIRFIKTISASLARELHFGDETGTQEMEQRHVSENAASLLPVLRVCCIWLGASRNEIFDTSCAWSLTVPSLCHTLGEVFTRLCDETYNRENLGTCPYLLSEDLESLGLPPFGKDRVPEACQCFCSEDGRLKPANQNVDQTLDSKCENMARVLDILRCAYFLAEDSDVPIQYQVIEDRLVFQYRDTEPAEKTLHNTPHLLGINQYAQISSPQNNLPRRPAKSTECGTTNGIIEYELQKGMEHRAKMGDPESTVMSMLSAFLKPPTPQPRSESQSQNETSYGMHTSTANEVFGAFQVDPSPTRSVASGKFEPLPWAWFNTPNPLVSTAAQDSATRRAVSIKSASPGVSPNMPTTGGCGAEDPFYTIGQQESTRSSANAFVSRGSTFDQTDTQRAQLLRTFANDQVRESPSGVWAKRATNWEETRDGRGTSAWSPRAAFNMPSSSFTSGFSNPSSLYQGTPANDIFRGSYEAHSTDRDQPPEALRGNQPELRTTSYPFHINRRTSDYDEAIFRAAYHDRK